MLVSSIAPYSVYPSYNKNTSVPAIKANQADSLSFKGKYLSELPKIMEAAKKVLKRMHGGVLEVEVPKHRTTCKANIGHFNRADHLCLCFDEKGQAIRYRIGLNDNNEISLLSELVKEKLPNRDSYMAESSLDLDEDSIQTLQTLLDALKTKKNIHAWVGYPGYRVGEQLSLFH